MRTRTYRFRCTGAVAAASLLLAPVLPLPALAQGGPPPAVQDQQGGDPPARVGRLARMSGSVSFHTQDENQWSPAMQNYPVTAGNAFWTDANAEADIEVSASLIAMAPTTELDITALTDTAFQATEPQGELYFRLGDAASGATYAVQTPRGAVMLASPGRYAVVAGDTDNPTRITVVEGAAQVTGPGLQLNIGPQQTAVITGTDTFQGQVGPMQPDPFLTAMLDRDRPRQQAAALPPSVAVMPGAEDLAQYGSWSDTPDYGQVWYPQVASDWVPYREGSWAYVAPWGWTWVDSEPWGFAPFHYGRWAEIGGRWGWVPGVAVDVRVPVYAPALVAFFGVGAGIGVGVGIGAALAEGRIGWCPLGPREAFRPWYRASPTYVRNVNIAHVTNITTINRNVTINNFANRRAVTVVPASAMTSSRRVTEVAQRVDPRQLGQARPVYGQQPLRPVAATVGVTPAVAREYHLPPATGRRAAPGPAIRPATAATVRPPLAGPRAAAPAAAGIQPLPAGPRPPAPPTQRAPTAPQLRPPTAPGQAGPPPIHREPAVAAPGGVPSGVAHPAPQVQHPGAPAPQMHAPAPAPVAPAPPPLTHAAPPPAAHVAPVPQMHAAPQPPPVMHAAPAAPPVVHAAPAPQVHAAPPPVVHAPPPQVHAAPPPQVHAAPPPMMHAAPPPQVHAAPPQQVRAAPPPQVHAAPPAPHRAPQPQPPNRNKKPGEP